jgi:hypothetical protein
MPTTRDCYNCGGDGYTSEAYPCPACRGEGRVEDLPPVTAPPARPILGVDDLDLILEALGHMAGSLVDAGRSPATVERLARLQARLHANRDTLGHLLAGVAPVLTMHEEA